MKIIISVSIFFTALMCSAQNDSICILKFIADDSGEALAFASIKISGDEVSGAMANADGIIQLNRKELIIGNVESICSYYDGYKRRCIQLDEALEKDTLVIQLELGPELLDEVVIVGYHVPLIDKGERDTRSEWERIQDEEEEREIAYTKEERDAYHYLAEGNTVMHDTSVQLNAVEPQTFYRYLQSLAYPKKAVDWAIQGKVYISFELDTKGYIQNIKLLRSAPPVLVLPIIDILRKAPLIKMNSYASDHSQKRNEFLLPVSFVLK